MDANTQIVLIGLTKQQIEELPEGIIGISRTDSIKALNEWYSIADIFINPTIEDNYPTTNLEAISSGTPVITFDTGGSPESAEIYGTFVDKGDVKRMISLIRNQTGEFKKISSDISCQAMIDEYKNVYI